MPSAFTRANNPETSPSAGSRRQSSRVNRIASSTSSPRTNKGPVVVPAGACVALKLAHEDAPEGFDREFELMGRVRGEYAVGVHATGTFHGRRWAVINYLPGHSLRRDAAIAQWHAERRSRRPKAAKLVVNDRLRNYAQGRGALRRELTACSRTGRARSTWEGTKPRRS